MQCRAISYEVSNLITGVALYINLIKILHDYLFILNRLIYVLNLNAYHVFLELRPRNHVHKDMFLNLQNRTKVLSYNGGHCFLLTKKLEHSK